jgi:hypothetical protein
MWDAPPVVSDEFVERWVARLRHEVPDAVAVFLGVELAL